MWMMNLMNDQPRRVIIPHFAQMLLSLFNLKSSQSGKMKQLAQSLGKSNSELNNFNLHVVTLYFTCVTCSKRVRAFEKLTRQQSTCKLCLDYVCGSFKIEKKPKFLTSNLNETRKGFTLCFSCLSDVMIAEEPAFSCTKKPRNALGILRRVCHSARSLRSPGWSKAKNSSSANFASSR